MISFKDTMALIDPDQKIFHRVEKAAKQNGEKYVLVEADGFFYEEAEKFNKFFTEGSGFSFKDIDSLKTFCGEMNLNLESMIHETKHMKEFSKPEKLLVINNCKVLLNYLEVIKQSLILFLKELKRSQSGMWFMPVRNEEFAA